MLVLAMPGLAGASDFWDEVRTPGLRAFRHQVEDARTALRARRFDAALAAAEQAVGLLPDRPDGHVLRGRALGELGQPQEAIAAFERGLSLADTALDDGEDGAHAAGIAAAAGAWELAARVLSRVLGRMSMTGIRRELYVLYGDVLLTLGPDRVRDAVLAYREALRAGPQDVRASLGLALALRRAGEPVEAQELARAATGHGRVDSLVAALPVPDSERAARRAVALDAIGDAAGARAAWIEARSGDLWRAHAESELARGTGDRPPARRRGARPTRATP
jgi:tetratricopeptide (TPR) repeat protein